MTPSRSPLLSDHSQFASFVCICLLTAAFVGCSPAPTGSPNRDARSLEEKSSAKAEEVYRSYIDASNEIDLADPATFEAVAEFTTERFHADALSSLTARYESGHVVRGKMKVGSFRVMTVLPDLNVEATACLDVSQVTMVDRHGESVLAEGAPGFFEMYLQFTSVDGKLLLDSEVAAPPSWCLTAGPMPSPAAPAPAAPGSTPAEPPREQDGNCTFYPDADLTICGR